ncbi:hypothetical protein ADL26_15695 [Thermoactinomyces vulgaris]|jgi:hypothetical protein|nr:hypothetical protein ADL26_15695 [Thermoactinomyces vulgaris]
MNIQDVQNELNQLRNLFSNEVNALKEQLAQLQQAMDRLNQTQPLHQPASVQEQMSQQIMSRTTQPDHEAHQYTGR